MKDYLLPACLADNLNDALSESQVEGLKEQLIIMLLLAFTASVDHKSIRRGNSLIAVSNLHRHFLDCRLRRSAFIAELPCSSFYLA